jgi:hypothetical protein
MQDSVFIFRKEYHFIALDLDTASSESSKLTDNGWKHVASLKASVWMQNFLNCSDTDRQELINEFYK